MSSTTYDSKQPSRRLCVFAATNSRAGNAVIERGIVCRSAHINRQETPRPDARVRSAHESPQAPESSFGSAARRTPSPFLRPSKQGRITGSARIVSQSGFRRMFPATGAPARVPTSTVFLKANNLPESRFVLQHQTIAGRGGGAKSYETRMRRSGAATSPEISQDGIFVYIRNRTEGCGFAALRTNWCGCLKKKKNHTIKTKKNNNNRSQTTNPKNTKKKKKKKKEV